MDKVEKSMIIIGIAVVILSLLFYNHAFGDYFAYRENKWDKEPTFCILKPTDYKDFKQYGISMGKIVQAVNTWKQELNQKTESHNWNYSIKVFPTYSSLGGYDCDVVIEFVNTGGGPFGTIECYTIIDTNRQYCDIVIYDQPVNHVLSTIKHEVGHALGLGHRLPWTKCDFAAVILSRDIMMMSAAKHQIITDDSLNALIAFYGKDGFKEPNPITDNKFWITEKPSKCV